MGIALAGRAFVFSGNFPVETAVICFAGMQE